jgi:hypothetical protein
VPVASLAREDGLLQLLLLGRSGRKTGLLLAREPLTTPITSTQHIHHACLGPRCGPGRGGCASFARCWAAAPPRFWATLLHCTCCLRTSLGLGREASPVAASLTSKGWPGPPVDAPHARPRASLLQAAGQRTPLIFTFRRLPPATREQPMQRCPRQRWGPLPALPWPQRLEAAEGESRSGWKPQRQKPWWQLPFPH